MKAPWVSSSTSSRATVEEALRRSPPRPPGYPSSAADRCNPKPVVLADFEDPERAGSSRSFDRVPSRGERHQLARLVYGAPGVFAGYAGWSGDS